MRCYWRGWRHWPKIRCVPIIELKITFHTPLHVGGGDTSADGVKLFARDVRGRPCIPASTLKGLHRASTERIAAAIGLRVCHPPDAAQLCHSTAATSACAVCRIFGSPWLPGSLRYRDLVLPNATTSVTPIIETRETAAQSRRRGVRLRYESSRREVLPAGTTFSDHIDYLLGDPALLGLALAGLRAITVIGSGNGAGSCTVEAKAFDATKRPVDESQLASALRQMVAKNS